MTPVYQTCNLRMVSKGDPDLPRLNCDLPRGHPTACFHRNDLGFNDALRVTKHNFHETERETMSDSITRAAEDAEQRELPIHHDKRDQDGEAAIRAFYASGGSVSSQDDHETMPPDDGLFHSHPVLLEAAKIMRGKAGDYGDEDLAREKYFPCGDASYFTMLHTKLTRVKSLRIDDPRGSNFEGARDSLIDLINYACFYVAWLDEREKRDRLIDETRG